MRKILLVKCSQTEGMPRHLTFPLGVMYLASSLRQASDDYEVQLYDMRTRERSRAELAKIVARFAPDVVGLSAITVEAGGLQWAARAVRQTGFDGPIVAGGPHPTAYPEETLAPGQIDYLVLGEGEESFTQLLDSVWSGKGPHAVPGIAYRESGQVCRSAPRPSVANPDTIPWPAWDLVDIDAYAKVDSMSGLRREPYMNLFTSRACPYRCTYCHSMFGRGFRARSPRSVVGEIRTLVDRYGIEYFEVVDDIFNCDLRRAKQILDLLHDEGFPIQLTFPNGLRCDRLDREFLEKLSRLKSSLICVPVESASPRIQRMTKKNLDLARVSKTIDACADLRIYTRGYFMLGFPGETREELKATVDFAVRSKLHAAVFFVVVPFKGTELYDMCLPEIEARNYAFEDHEYSISPMNVSGLPDDVLFGVQRWAYVRLGMSPSRIYRMLRDFPDYRFVWRGLRSWVARFAGAGQGLSQEH